MTQECDWFLILIGQKLHVSLADLSACLENVSFMTEFVSGNADTA